MKKLISLLSIVIFGSILLNSFQANAQAPNWLWAKGANGSGSDYSAGVSADASGNVYVTGYFSSPSITFGTTILSNAGNGNIYVVKYDAAGNVVWAKSEGGSGNDVGQGISVDASGNVYVTGYFDSPSLTFGTTTLTNTGGYDIFVVKYNGAGNVVWAQSASGTGSDEANSVGVDGAGNVYITGFFDSPSFTFGTTTLANAGNQDVFVAAMDANGNPVWAKKAGGTGDESARSISVDFFGNLYITGKFISSPLTFGSSTITNSSGNDNIFIAKYNAAGTAIWAKGVGGTAGESGESIKIDGSGNVYATGSFFSPSIMFGIYTLTNSGSENLFIAKLDASGTVLWAKKAGSIYVDEAHGVSTDGGGNAYITGYFTSPTILFGTTTLTNTGSFSSDIFIAKYDPSGNVVWAKGAGGTSDDLANGISVENSGNTNITGYFNSSTISFGTSTLNNAGSSDVFTAKLDNVTGISENVSQSIVSIFPNPSSGIFYLNSDKKIISTELYDLLGNKAAIIPLNSFGEIDLSDRPNGIYFLNIKTEEGSLTKKIVVEK